MCVRSRFSASVRLGSSALSSEGPYQLLFGATRSFSSALDFPSRMPPKVVREGKRKLTGKQRAPAHYVLPAPAYRALTAEGWSELVGLDGDVRRRHMHWVHVRTHDENHRQPDTFTREAFWQHMCKVYKDTYPDPGNQSTGSILLFGMVCKEKHAHSEKEAERAEHNHFATFSAVQHYWRPVAERSLLTYGVKLHAACHEGYTSMYVYLRCPTPKKPLRELDAAPYFSPEHPQGEVLQKLLQKGVKAVAGCQRRSGKSGSSGDTGAEHRRVRPGDLYTLASQTGVRTVEQLRAYAQNAAAAGDKRFAEFCTGHKEDSGEKKRTKTRVNTFACFPGRA